MLSDKKNVLELVALMKAHHIHQVVLCPGSRNIPLVQTFSASQEFECYGITDERSAGFFALGLALQSGRPAAVCCTSGTALLNLHPAVAEAAYQQIPLLIISADRPAAWIGQMDGQTLQQPGVFDRLDVPSWQLPEFSSEEDHWYVNRQINEALCLLEKRQPVHLNLPLSEPLFQFTESVLPEVRTIHRSRFPAQKEEMQVLLGQMARYQKIMLVIGQYPPHRGHSVPYGPLPASVVCLSEHIGNHLCPDALQNFDSILAAHEEEEALLKELTPELIITLGGHLVSKRFKKFIRNHPPKAHWHIDPEGRMPDLFCALSRVIEIQPEDLLQLLQSASAAATFPDALPSGTPAAGQAWAEKWKRLSRLIPPSFPAGTEMGAIAALIRNLPKHSVLHLSNSSAIRYAQLFELDPSIEVHGNRGTSGIEGSLSTAAGFAAADTRTNFVIIGDLSFFYDANALWNSYASDRLRILLLNNGGGEIFKTLPQLELTEEAEKYILGTHESSAEGWAHSMGLDYYSAHNEMELASGLQRLTEDGDNRQTGSRNKAQEKSQGKARILEVFTDSSQDSQLLKEYYKSLKNK